MYKTRLKSWIFIVFAILFIGLAIFGTLFFLDYIGVSDFFNFVKVDDKKWLAISACMISVSGALLVITICLFLFYYLAIKHNNKTIDIVKILKERFATSRGVELDEVDDALIDLKDEIREAKKHGIILQRPANSPNQQNTTNIINVQHNIVTQDQKPQNAIVNPQGQKVVTTTTTTTNGYVPYNNNQTPNNQNDNNKQPIN